MSDSCKSGKQERGVDSLSDRLKDSLSCDTNKPDFKELDVGSPVSTLRTRQTIGTAAGHSGRLTATTTTTSSSSSSSGSSALTGRATSSPVAKSHSDTSGTSIVGGTPRTATPGRGRSNSSGAYGSSGGGSVNSPRVNVLPTGNICPSGRICTGMATRQSHRSDVLGTGMGNYGYGSIMRGGSGVGVGSSSGGDAGIGGVKGNVCIGDREKKEVLGADPEELKRLGNEQYRIGNFSKALIFYDQAITISPRYAAIRSNRAAALMGLGRVREAVRESEEVLRLDPGFVKARHRLGVLLIRLGQVEAAREHLFFKGQQPEVSELQKLEEVEKYLSKCSDARKIGDWKSTLREGDAAIAAGADHCPQLIASRAESLLKLQQLYDADGILSNLQNFDPPPQCCSRSKFFGMLSEAYLFYVEAQMEMSIGRFEDAATSAERAGRVDPWNAEVAALVKNVSLVTKAHARGNDLFMSERFTEACTAYEEGLRVDPLNSVIYCNRAACFSKLKMWQRSVEDCNIALQIQPGYTKALLRRADSNYKLERWAEAVRDYQLLRRELPNDKEVAGSLFHAQVALKKSHGEDVTTMKFDGEMEAILSLEQFRAEISPPGVSVVHFKRSANPHCKLLSPFFDMLSARYPSINFLEVSVEENPAIADAENVRTEPTIKIYKNGFMLKEMVNPTRELLEASVRHHR
ncbi:hypothetical protein Nepgr_026089 [Nepenthes gracilis]|uniref:Thioredoxin domain-containing protein n=1 Tax=Nepenthes gracilis TaxID=150966 RepID=A0AAD3T956_NEPGR|nr:hypothetical protein Nepgr_026089 [Nepenthes gracilis]